MYIHYTHTYNVYTSMLRRHIMYIPAAVKEVYVDMPQEP